MVEVPEADGFNFELDQDSLADSMGLKLPSRSLMVVTAKVGGGKSLISQRLTFGLLENGAKVVYVIPNSPAEREGLKINDIIVYVNSVKVKDPDDVVYLE